MYIDADTYIIKNIDELFDYPDMSMSAHHADMEGISNGGVLVIEPRVGMYEQALDFLEISCAKN